MGAPASESLRSDAKLQPQGTDSVQNISASSFVKPPTAFFSLQNSLISNVSPRDLTPEQAQAIAVLKDYHDSDIIAWHKLSQSTEPSLRHRDRPGGLSAQEIHAISILRECSHESLIQWLGSSSQEISKNPGLSTSRLAAAALSRQVRRLSSGSGHISGHSSVANSVKANSPYLRSNPYSASTAVQNPLDLHQTFPRVTTHSKSALVNPANPDHKYWCTVCENRSFQHSDSWKKHEKEHEIKFVCMLKGLFETTDNGRRCVLCGALNQADNHHLVHKLAPCVDAAKRPSFKRPYEMVKHLKDAHDIHDIASGKTITDKWRCESSKNAWSCGFCINLSQSVQDHLKHIGTEHFEKGQSIKDWKYSNIIQGLLLQPGMKEAWIHLLDSLDPFRLSKFKWNKSGSENLLHKLEKGLMSKETPQSLAKAAYDSAEFDWSTSDHDITTSASITNTAPSRYLSESSLLPSQHHAVRTEKASVLCQPWSPPPQGIPQIPKSSPNSEAQSAYGKGGLDSSPAQLLSTLDQGPEWDPLTSDTGDMNSTRPTTPSNDHNFYPADPSIYDTWSSYNITPDPARSEQETVYYKGNHKADWPTHPHPAIEASYIGSIVKRPRDSVSPSIQTLPRKNTYKDRPKKKTCRKNSEGIAMASRGLGIHCPQHEMDLGEDIRSEMRAKESEYGLYE